MWTLIHVCESNVKKVFQSSHFIQNPDFFFKMSERCVSQKSEKKEIGSKINFIDVRLLVD